MSFRKQELLRLKRTACDSKTSREVYAEANQYLCDYAQEIIDVANTLAGEKTIKTTDIVSALSIVEGKRVVTDFSGKRKANAVPPQ
jgi:histone H3/H4